MMEVDEVSTTTGGAYDNTNSSDGEETIVLMQAQIDIQKEKINDLVEVEHTEQLKTQVQELLNWKENVIKHGCTCGASKELKNVENQEGSRNQLFASDWTEKDGSSNVSVVDLVKETAQQIVAEQQQQQSGFVYNEKTGWYFDASRGYYYDPRTNLTYSIHEKKYYKYDTDRKEYDLYPTQAAEHELAKFKSSQPKILKNDKKRRQTSSTEVAVPEACKSLNKSKVKHVSTRKKPPTSQNKKPSKKVKEDHDNENMSGNEIDMEEGEIPSSSASEQESDGEVSSSISASTDSESDPEEEEPAPCIRAIVLSSSVTSVKKGTLFIVTCTGGTIGREGQQHAILIEDANISKMHAAISYDYAETQNNEDEDASKISNTDDNRRKKCYYVVDCKSKNGTYLNGQDLSGNKCEIQHGSTLKVGDTTLLLHIHPGQFTCGHCEPGLVIEKKPMYEVGPVISKERKETERKKEMKKLRKKYCLEYDATETLSKLPQSYTDRAEDRRITKGSDNPFEKTQVTSIDEAITEENRGYNMLRKMGWKDGNALGHSGDQGITEPIKFKLKTGRSGLGSSHAFPNEESLTPVKLSKKKKQTKEKYQTKYDKRSEILQTTINRYNKTEETGK